MTYKEFVGWCNDRACDGAWSIDMAIICIDMMDAIRKAPLWRRKKKWESFEPIAAQLYDMWRQHYDK